MILIQHRCLAARRRRQHAPYLPGINLFPATILLNTHVSNKLKGHSCPSCYVTECLDDTGPGVDGSSERPVDPSLDRGGFGWFTSRCGSWRDVWEGGMRQFYIV